MNTGITRIDYHRGQITTLYTGGVAHSGAQVRAVFRLLELLPDQHISVIKLVRDLGDKHIGLVEAKRLVEAARLAKNIVVPDGINGPTYYTIMVECGYTEAPPCTGLMGDPDEYDRR